MRQRYGGVAVRPGLQADALGDDLVHDLVGAAADPQDPAVPVDPLDLGRAHVSQPAEQLDGLVDNVVRDGKVIDPDNPDPNIRGVRRFTELVAAEPRLSSTVLQTVGGKGYDGFAISIVLS